MLDTQVIAIMAAILKAGAVASASPKNSGHAEAEYVTSAVSLFNLANQAHVVGIEEP